MSILNVEHLTHGFGDRAIFNDVSFRLLKGEHIGLIGANGEGKSTFMNIITGKLMPDEGKIEWAKNVRVGYLDQHTVLEKGMTIEDVLKSAFNFLFDMEAQMNDICDKMGEASEEELEQYCGEYRKMFLSLPHHSFICIFPETAESAAAGCLSAACSVERIYPAIYQHRACKVAELQFADPQYQGAKNGYPYSHAAAALEAQLRSAAADPSILVTKSITEASKLLQQIERKECQ